MKKRFTKEQIIGFLREAETGLAVKDLCRRHGCSEASYYLWKSKFGGMSVPDAKTHPCLLDATLFNLEGLLRSVLGLPAN